MGWENRRRVGVSENGPKQCWMRRLGLSGDNKNQPKRRWSRCVSLRLTSFVVDRQ